MLQSKRIKDTIAKYGKDFCKDAYKLHEREGYGGAGVAYELIGDNISKICANTIGDRLIDAGRIISEIDHVREYEQDENFKVTSVTEQKPMANGDRLCFIELEDGNVRYGRDYFLCNKEGIITQYFDWHLGFKTQLKKLGYVWED